MENDRASEILDLLQSWFEALKSIARLQEELKREGWTVFVGKVDKYNRLYVPTADIEKLKLNVNERVLVSLSRLTNSEKEKD